MAGPEATIERTLADEAEDGGWLSYKLTFLDRKGAPDRIFGKDGETIVIEVKPPTARNRKNGGRSESQVRCHRELRLWFGWEVFTIYSLDEGRRLLGLKGGT